MLFRCVLSEELSTRAMDLYAAGSSFGSIGKELDVSKSRVGGLIRDGIESLRGNHVDVPAVQVEAERVNAPKDEEISFSAFENDSGLNGMLEKTILIQAQPIFRKVVLNSKVFLQHEYFQKALGYQGDVGDLLVEALDYYWKEMGFTIKITHDSVI